MFRNMSNLDRAVRALVAAGSIAIALAVGASSVAGIILLAFAAIMLLTGAVAMCPIYRLLGLSTCHVAAKGRA